MLIGIAACLLCGNVALGLGMAAAVLLKMIVAAVVGVSVPLFLSRTRRDPAQGASGLLTFTTGWGKESPERREYEYSFRREPCHGGERHRRHAACGWGRRRPRWAAARRATLPRPPRL